MKIKEMSKKEYEKSITKEIHEKGIYEFIKNRCDEIDDITSVLGYVPRMNVQENLCEILHALEIQKKYLMKADDDLK